MAGVNKCAKDQETRPLPGALDLRSPDGAVKRGYVRILLNLLVGEDGHLTRMGGFHRLGWDAPHFCNQDLHDQLDGLASPPPPCVTPQKVWLEAGDPAPSGAVTVRWRQTPGSSAPTRVRWFKDGQVIYDSNG